MKVAHFAVAAVLAITPAALLAQPPSGRVINQRKENQQDRIAQGVRSGQLTPRETARLEHQEASINREEHRMRTADAGHLTPQDRRILTRQQNRESRRINRDKHNGRVS
jgi:hypothetical protein